MASVAHQQVVAGRERVGPVESGRSAAASHDGAILDGVADGGSTELLGELSCNEPDDTGVKALATDRDQRNPYRPRIPGGPGWR